MLMAFVFVLAIAAIASDTSVGRTLRAALTHARLPRPTLGQVAVVVLLIVFTTTLILVLKTDGLALAARALPEGMAWFTAFDVATYLDVVAFTALAALALRLRVVWTFVRGAAAWCAHVVQTIQRRRSTRAHRTPRVKGPKSGADDIEWVRGAAFA